MSSGGGSGGGSSTTTQKLDPWMKEQIQGQLNDIDALGQRGYQAYPGSPNAPVTGDMRQQLGQMNQIGNMGFGTMRAGQQGLLDVAGSQAQQVGTNFGADQVSLGQLNMGQFSNPYEDQVVNQAMSDMDRARQMTMMGTEDQAFAAGAFGGSRHGVADAETNRAFADRAGALAGQLRQQGFNTALGAAQQQQGMGLQADLSNQQANLSADQLVAQQQRANQSAGLDANRLQLLANQGLLGAGQSMLGIGGDAAQFWQDRAQAGTDQARADFAAQQAYPGQIINMRNAALGNLPMMGTTTSTTPGGSRLGGALGGGFGGAAMGAQLGSVVPGLGTGIGAAVGGGLGLLGGMFR